MDTTEFEMNGDNNGELLQKSTLLQQIESAVTTFYTILRFKNSHHILNRVYWHVKTYNVGSPTADEKKKLRW